MPAPSASAPAARPAVANEPVSARRNRITASPLIANGRRVIIVEVMSTAKPGTFKTFA